MFLKFVFIVFYFICVCGQYSDDEVEVVPQPSSKTLELFKCHCKSHQVFDRSICQDSITTVLRFSHDVKQWITIATKGLGNVSVQDVNCSSGTFPVLIDSVLFLEDGSLYDAQNIRKIAPDKFCFDHILENNEIKLIAKTCQSIPSIPQCCSGGYVLDSALNCKEVIGFDFEMSFGTNNKFKNIPGNIQLINKCSSGLDLQVVNISDPENPLKLILSESNEAFLQQNSEKFHEAFKVNSSEFCVAAREDQSSYYYDAFYCKESVRFDELCSNVLCVRKCCPLNTIFQRKSQTCMENNFNTSDPLFKNILPSQEKSTYQVITAPPSCKSYLKFDIAAGEIIDIKRNGYIRIDSQSKNIPPSSYCIENIDNENTIAEKIFVCNDDIQGEDNCSWNNILICTLLAISSLFLLITFIVYISIKDLRGRISGKCLISKVFALLVAYVGIVIQRTMHNKLQFVECRIVGIIVHIFILAAFFWLNVMCIDMWITIRSHTPIEDKSKSKTRFIIYSIYGWGSPLIIGIIGIILDSVPDRPNKVFIRPGMGEARCFFNDIDSTWAYLYGIILVLLLVNMVLFVHIVIFLMKAKKKNEKIFTDQCRTQEGNKNASMERCWTYVKLFIVMGISWLAEVISSKTEVIYPRSCYVWLASDILNCLRGLMIFIIFVCKKTTLRKIHQAWFRNLSQRKEFGFLRWNTTTDEVHTRSSHLSSSSYKNRNTSSSSYKKNQTDSLSMAEVPQLRVDSYQEEPKK